MKQALLLLSLFAALTISAVHAMTLTIGIDLSKSNPLLADPAFAEGAAQYIYKQALTLQKGDVVRLLYFGSRSDVINLATIEREIGRKYRSKKAANEFGQIIAQLPKKINEAQASTNIIAFTEFTSGFNCSDGSEIILITDGLEASEYMTPNQLASGKKHLPKPDVNLSGCNVTFYGLGAGLSPSAVKNIRKEWHTYFKGAEANFNAIIK